MDCYINYQLNQDCEQQYQFIMLSAQLLETKIAIFRGQLYLKGIQINHAAHFKQFWRLVIQEGSISENAEHLIREFVCQQNYQPFCNYVQQYLMTIQTIQNENQLLDKGKKLQMIQNSEQKVEQQVCSFDYNLNQVTKTALIIIISDKKINSVKILLEGHDIGMKCQEISFQEEKVSGYCLKMPINLQNINIEAYSVKVTYTAMFFLKKQIIFDKLDQKIQFHSGKKGVILLKLGQQSSDIFLKKFLLRISRFIYERQNKDWVKVKSWWYLIKKMYIKQNIDEEKQIVDSIKPEKKDSQFLKYYLWLLNHIFGKQYDHIKIKCHFFKEIDVPQNYIFPQGLDEQHIIIEQNYLKSLIQTKFAIKKKKVQEWNLEYQPDYVQASIIPDLSNLFITQHEDLILKKYITNNYISIKIFVDKFFTYFRNQKLDLTAINAKTSNQRQRKTQTSILVMRIFTYLKEKCDNSREQLNFSRKQEQFYLNHFTYILYAPHLNGTSILRLANSHIFQYLKLATGVGLKFPQLNQIMVSALNMNAFKIRSILGQQFLEGLRLIVENGNANLIDLMKGYIRQHRQKLFDLVQRDEGQMKNIEAAVIFINNNMLENNQLPFDFLKELIQRINSKNKVKSQFYKKFRQKVFQINNVQYIPQQPQQPNKKYNNQQPQIDNYSQISEDSILFDIKINSLNLDNPILIEPLFKNLFFVIISKEKIRQLFRDNRNIIQGGSKHQIKRKQLIGNFCYYPTFNYNQIIQQRLSICDQQSKIVINVEDVRLDQNQQNGLVWLNQKLQISGQEQYIFMLNSINILCCHYAKEIKQLLPWVQIFKSKLKTENKSLFIKSVNEFLSDATIDKFSFQLLYAIIAFSQHLFSKECLELLFQECGRLSRFGAIRWNKYYEFLIKLQENTEKIQLFKILTKFCLQIFVRDKKISLSLMAGIIKISFQMVNPNIGKEIINYIIIKESRRLLAEVDKDLTIYCKNNPAISAYQILSIKSFYLKQIILPNNIVNEFSQIFEVINSKNQSLSSDSQRNKIQIKRSDKIIKKQLQQMFFQNTSNSFINHKNSNETNKKCIIRSKKELYQLYDNIKTLQNDSIHHIMNQVFIDYFTKRFRHEILNDSQFDQIMKLLLKKPMRKQEFIFISNTFDSQSFKPQMVSKLFRILVQQQQYIQNQEYVKNIILEMITKRPQLSYYSKSFINQFNKIGDNVKNHILFIKKVYQKIAINKEDIVNYIKSAVLLTNQNIKNICIDRICQHFQYWNKTNEFKQQDLFLYVWQAFGCLNNIKQENYIKQILFENYYKRIKVQLTEAQKVEEIWKYLLKRPQQLHYIEYKYFQQIEILMNQINQKIEDKNLLKQELQLLANNLHSLPVFCKRLRVLLRITDMVNEVRKLVANLHNLAEIFENLQHLQQEYDQIKLKIRSYQEEPIINLEAYMEKYYDYDDDIKIFMNLKSFNKEGIKNYDSLISEFKRVRETVKSCLRQYNHHTFKEVIDPIIQISQQRLIYLCSKQEINIQQIKQFRRVFHKQYLKSLAQMSNAILFLMEQKDTIISEQQRRLSIIIDDIIKSIQSQEDNKDNITDYYKSILNCEQNIRKILPHWQFDTKALVIRYTYRNRQFFKKMDSVEVSTQKLKNLRQYSNQLQNSIAKGDIIREFKNVFEYWQCVKKYSNLKNVLKSIQNLLKIHGFVDLHKNIENCSMNINMLFQKLDEASDLSLSFKYEVEAILKKSTLFIAENSSGIQLKVIIQINGEKRDNIYFEKLQSFKQKAMLVQQYENTEKEENRQTKLELLKTYIELYDELFKIKVQCQDLINYGYDPKLLTKKIEIFQGIFSEVSKQRQQLQKIKHKWLKQIKQISGSSFVLTHFIGPNLVRFINNVIKGKLYDSLRYILFLDEGQFQKIMKQKKDLVQELQKRGSEPIQKVRLVKDIFSSFDNPQKIEDSQQHQKIKLITSDEKSFYCHIVKENGDEIPLPNQVIICHLQTRIQELEFFIHRALINRNNHFIIGIHRVSQQVQASFIKFIREIKNQKLQFRYSKLVFIDNDIRNTVYSYLTKPRVFQNQIKLNSKQSQEQMEKVNKILVRKIPQSWIVSSSKAGLGKTHFVEKKANQLNQKTYHFPIGGNVSFSQLGSRLKQLNFSGRETLLLKIGFVVNKQHLEIFLSQLIMLRCFFAQQYIYIHPQTHIFVQIENIVSDNQLQGKSNSNYIDEKYYILNILKDNNFKYELDCFETSMICFENSEQDQFVFLYLNLLDINEINTSNILFDDIKDYKFIQKPRKYQLVEKYFAQKIRSKKLQPTFLQYTYFMKILFQIFDTFSKNPTLLPESLKWQFNDNFLNEYKLKNYRQYFIETCMENSMSIIEQTFTQNKFRSQMNQGPTFREMKSQFKMLILPSFTKDSYRFVYLKDQHVPAHIKLYNIIQNQETFKMLQGPSSNSVQKIFSMKCSYNGDKKQVQARMIEVLNTISQDVPENFKQNTNFKDYVLTMDNFFKMCLIVLRYNCQIPCVIEGESGVGKTALIKFLVENIFQAKLHVFNINAGIHYKQISQIMKNIIIMAKQQRQWNRNKKIWVFFDEFNTTDQLAYIKEIIIEHRFMGEKLPDNIHIIAACNPYRIKRVVNKKIKQLKSKKQKHMAFRVHPPPFSMIQIMWDYQQLTPFENYLYIQKMLEINKEYPIPNNIVNVIVRIHQKIKQNVQISAVSLRDVQRFKKLYIWFFQYIANTQKVKSKRITRKDQRVDKNKKALILSLLFCYCLRFSQEQERQQYMKVISSAMGWNINDMKQIIDTEQRQFVNQLKIPDNSIAINTALKENTFTTFVCIMNKIPVLLIGAPGSSKSLSVRILASNLNGLSSDREICRQYPEVNMIYFQGSESSTSEGVEQVFKKADLTNGSSKYSFLNCIYFDQIGLAQKSSHNPLKVLHSKLEIHNQNKVSFIGISNDELDSAKMSRFLILNRPPPSLKQLNKTAQQICQTQVRQNDIKLKLDVLKKIGSMGDIYSLFITQWEKTTHQNGFFGLRDFYNYVKYMCKKLVEGNYIKFEEELNKAATINFDGQNKSLEIFRKCINQINKNNRTNCINYLEWNQSPFEIIQNNLLSKDSRCLLLIVRGQTLLPIIQKQILQYRNSISVIYGSAFQNDEKSQTYNLNITRQVITYMSKGDVVVFKDINNSIQSSLYQLFNKSYILNGRKKYCRIAVGANSNPQCFVNDNFNAIVFMDERKIRSLDSPFLNRFEKHFLLSQSIMNKGQIHLKTIILDWIKKVLLKNKHGSLSHKNFIFNIEEQALITIILKYRHIKNDDEKQRLIKRDILQNKTFDFCLLYYNNPQQSQNLNQQFQQLKCMTPQDDPEDLIIYTYDQFIHLHGESNNSLLDGAYRIRLSEITSENQLKDKLEEALPIQKYAKCVILVNLIRDFNLIQQTLFLSKKVKQERQSKGKIIILIQLHRFTFMQNPDLNINISYLHQFNQYFKQSLSIQIANLLQNAKYYLDIFNLFQMKTRIKEFYIEGISLMKIIQNQQNANIYIFGKLTNLIHNIKFIDKLEQFLLFSLKNEKVAYELIHTNKKQILQCSTTLQALENLTKQITIKYIIVFIELICSGNYLDIFQQRMEIEGQYYDQKIYQHNMKRVLFELQLEDKKNIISLKDRSLIKKINYFKQSNQVVVGNHNIVTEETSKFIQSLKQNYSHQKQIVLKYNIQDSLAVNRQYEAFRFAFQQQINKYPLSSKLYQTQQFKGIFLKELLNYQYKKLPEILLSKLQIFMENVLFSSHQHLITFIMLENNHYFNCSIQLLEILFSYYQNFQMLMKEFTQVIHLRQNKSIQNNCQLILQKIFQVIINLTRANKQNVKSFGGADIFFIFNKQLANTINNIYDQIETVSQIPASYILLKNFYDFIDLGSEQSEIFFIKFLNFRQQQPLSERIYNYIVKQINEDISQRKYESFLSFYLFDYWISQSKQNNQQLSSCLEKIKSWCDKSIQFANRSEKFFEKLLGYIFESNTTIEQVLLILPQKDIPNFKNLPISNFSLALNNYFVKKVTFMLSKKCSKAKNVLQCEFQIFQKITEENISYQNINGNFKIAFTKVYLTQYLSSLRGIGTSNILKQIDNCISQKNFFKKYCRIFLVNNLRLSESRDDIQRNYLLCNRCSWIKLQEQLILEESQTILQSKQQVNQKDIIALNFFKGIQAISRLSDNLQDQIYKRMKQKNMLIIEKQYPLLHFIISLNQDPQHELTIFLHNAKTILHSLTNINKACNLKIRKYESKMSVKSFLHQCVSLKQKEQIKMNLRQFNKSLKSIKNRMNNLSVIKRKISSLLYLNPENQQNILESFLMIPQQQNQECNSDLIIFVQQLARCYNDICQMLKTCIKKICPHSVLLKEQKTQIDPTQVTKFNILLDIPDVQYLKEIVAKYSNYSIQPKISELQYFFFEIEGSILKSFKNIPMLKASRDTFNRVRFIGESNHFLIDMKRNKKYRTLKEIGKLFTIKNEIKKIKERQEQTFYKTIKRIQNNLQIVLVYEKNKRNQNQASQSMNKLLELHNLTNIAPQLVEEPFKSLPSFTLVDLYELFQQISFPNIAQLVSQSYRDLKIQRQEQKNLNKLIQIMKQARDEQYPSLQQFKKAIYRLVIRYVLTDLAKPNETIKQYLYQSHLWDQNALQKLQRKNEYLDETLQIKLRHLYFILEKVPYELQWLELEEEPSIVKPKKHRLI